MAPDGYSSSASNSGANHKFSLFSGQVKVEDALEELLKKEESVRKERVCVVSIIGKSSSGYQGCKAGSVDEAIGRNIFRGMFGEKKTLSESLGTEVECFVDMRNKVVFLHMLSPLDSDILTHLVAGLHKDLNEKGFVQVWTGLQTNVAKTLLLLFSLSHIVVTVQPSPQFDLNYLHLFRLLDVARNKAQPYLSEILREIPSLPLEWVEVGRPCSPRVLFVFEAFENQALIKPNRRHYEQYLEDQIYRFLRKSRIITNICANSLFAICNQMDFVFMATENPSIRDPQQFLTDLLYKFCSSDDNPREEVVEDPHTFYSFLWTHINVALTKGFDDNVGRHNVVTVFELPTVEEFFAVLSKLKGFFFDESGECKESKIMSNHLQTCLDTDIRFSEARCSKGLPMAMGIYQDGLPSHYTREYHERKVAQALQMFAVQARGDAMYKFASDLKDQCDHFWKNGHQMCEKVSLTGNNCVNSLHRLKGEDPDPDLSDQEEMENERLPLMAHCSNVKLLSACDCGRRQMTREDPFSVKAANRDFYALLSMKCNCGHLERVDFPVFEPSTFEAKAAPSAQPFVYVESNTSSDSPTTASQQEFQSQPDIRASFTNLSQSSTGIASITVEPLKKADASLKDDDIQESGDAVSLVPRKVTSELSANSEDAVGEVRDEEDGEGDEDEEVEDEEDGDEDEEEEEEEEDDVRLIIREANSPYFFAMKQSSTTEYLAGMLHSLSPPGLLPQFSSWSLVCLGPSSLYSHNIGLMDQPGFISGTNFLLPWDVTVKLEHSGQLPPLWEGKRPPGIKNKKNLKDGTQFTVKIFLGVEYECPRGHRFICSGPNSILRASMGIVKENATSIANSDLPLYVPCVCSRTGKQLLAQLMRIHVVTPKAPVHVTLDPKVQPAPLPCPLFYPGNSGAIKLSQSTYWILRLPFVYKGDHGVYMPPKDRAMLDNCRLLKGTFGVADFVTRTRL